MLLIVLPIVVLALRLFFPFYNTKYKNMFFMILCFFVVVFFVGLRSRYTGSPDTRTYAFIFEQAQGKNLLNFLNSKEISIKNFIYNEGVFYFFIWSLAQIFNNAQALIFIASAVITIGVSSFIWKNSKSDTLSWILYICLGLLTFSMNGMRQALAMSICLLSFEFVKQKKIFKFLLVIFIAFTFHRTAVVFLLVYPLFNYKSSTFSNIIVSCCFIAFLFNTTRIAKIYDYFTGEDYSLASEMDGGGLITVLIYVITILLSYIYIFICSKEKNKKIVIKLTLLSFLGLIFYISRYFSTQIYERVSYYFFYFIILLIPEIENLFNKKNSFIFKVTVILISILIFTYRLSVSSFSDFKFFW